MDAINPEGKELGLGQHSFFSTIACAQPIDKEGGGVALPSE